MGTKIQEIATLFLRKLNRNWKEIKNLDMDSIGRKVCTKFGEPKSNRSGLVVKHSVNSGVKLSVFQPKTKFLRKLNRNSKNEKITSSKYC